MEESYAMKEFEVDDGSNISRNPRKGCIRSNLLTILTMVGVLSGGLLGFILRVSREAKWTQREVMYISFLGDLFLRVLKSLILPLIVSSLVSAVSHLDLSLSGKIARRAVSYYLTTTFCAVVLGIIIVVAMAPGKVGSKFDSSHHHPISARNVTTVDTLLDLVRNVFPPNIVEACIRQTRTLLIPPAKGTGDIYQWEIESEHVNGMNILGLVTFAAILGIALAKMGPQGTALRNVFDSLTGAMMTITTWVIWISPIGILFLVASKIIEIDDIGQVGGQLGMYFATVMVGVGIQGILVLPLLYWILTRKSPFLYVSNLAQALATAFGTASSTATLPVTIRCLEENSGLDSRIVRFCLPIGATINMDGTALYEAVAAIFIAQVREVELGIGHLVAISITATAASIGAAGIPQAGLVTLVMVLDTVGLPPEDVTLILAVDWLLDRFRTVINVMGDAFGAGIVDHFSKGELPEPEVERNLQ